MTRTLLALVTSVGLLATGFIVLGLRFLARPTGHIAPAIAKLDLGLRVVDQYRFARPVLPLRELLKHRSLQKRCGGRSPRCSHHPSRCDMPDWTSISQSINVVAVALAVP